MQTTEGTVLTLQGYAPPRHPPQPPLVVMAYQFKLPPNRFDLSWPWSE